MSELFELRQICQEASEYEPEDWGLRVKTMGEVDPKQILKLLDYVELVDDHVSCDDPNCVAGKIFGSFNLEACGRCKSCEILKARKALEGQC